MARGSVVKRKYKKAKNGINYTYAIIYYIDQKPKWETVGPNLKEAQRLLAQRLAEVSNGTYFKPKEVTFGAFSEQWLETKKLRVKPSTYRGYMGDLRNHLLPSLKDKLLTNISREQAERILNKLRGSRSADTVNNIRLLMLMIFNYAKSLRYVNFNPIEGIKPFPLEHKEMDFLNPKEVSQLLRHSQEPYKTLLLTAILTGMRRGEILGLQWGDIDWNSNTLFVTRSLYWLTNKERLGAKNRWKFVEPKTKRSKRAIVLSPKLKEALRIHQINSTISPYDLVFCNKEGNPIDPDNFVKREFHSILRFSGLRKIRFHDLRHTYCSLLISQGENIKFIQAQLGHASIQTTIDRYGHLMPYNHHGVGLKLDSQIFDDIGSNQVDNLKVKEKEQADVLF